VLSASGCPGSIFIERAFLVHGMIVPGFTSGGYYGPVSVGAPDNGQKDICKAFGAKVVKVVKQLKVKG